MSARSDPWADRLSDYLDGELSPAERRACERHLAGCADCSAVLAELRAVVARAERMRRSVEPQRDLWPAIANRLAPPRPLPVLVGWLRPQLAAAALLLLACAAVAVWLVYVRTGRQVLPQAAPPASAVELHAEPEREYEASVALLDRQARARLTLDPHLVEVLDDNLATLDAAISNYREALSEDPRDAELRRRLDAARQKKLDVLRQAVTLANEGNE